MTERSDWPERRDEFRLRSDWLTVQEVVDAVKSRACGAVSVFIGTTREDLVEGRKVIGLQYEAYEAMVQSELSKLSQEIRGAWPEVRHICVHHRLGWVGTGEDSVMAAISSPHRRHSEEAIQFLITQLKAKVPIWKKEVYENSESSWKENVECSWSQKHKNQDQDQDRDRDLNQDQTQS